MNARHADRYDLGVWLFITVKVEELRDCTLPSGCASNHVHSGRDRPSVYAYPGGSLAVSA